MKIHLETEENRTEKTNKRFLQNFSSTIYSSERIIIIRDIIL